MSKKLISNFLVLCALTEAFLAWNGSAAFSSNPKRKTPPSLNLAVTASQVFESNNTVLSISPILPSENAGTNAQQDAHSSLYFTALTQSLASPPPILSEFNDLLRFDRHTLVKVEFDLGKGRLKTFSKVLADGRDSYARSSFAWTRESSDDESEKLRDFLNEIRVLQALRSIPNVLQTRGIEIKTDAHGSIIHHYTELANNGTVAELVLRRTTTPAQDLQIAAQIFRTLESVHSLGYVHRDIKPDNLFVHSLGNEILKIILGDFDRAYYRDDLDYFRSASFFNEPGVTAYSHPEQSKLSPDTSQLSTGLRSRDTSREIPSSKMRAEIFHKDLFFDHWSAGLTLLNIIRRGTAPWQEGSDAEVEEKIGQLTQDAINETISETLSVWAGSKEGNSVLQSILSCSLQIDLSAERKNCNFKRLSEEALALSFTQQTPSATTISVD